MNWIIQKIYRMWTVVRAKMQINEFFMLCDLGQAPLPRSPSPRASCTQPQLQYLPLGGCKDSMSQHDLSRWAVQQWGESSPSHQLDYSLASLRNVGVPQRPPLQNGNSAQPWHVRRPWPEPNVFLRCRAFGVTPGTEQVLCKGLLLR